MCKQPKSHEIGFKIIINKMYILNPPVPSIYTTQSGYIPFF